jgi:alkylresorcinol/alkylpyrone synthase
VRELNASLVSLATTTPPHVIRQADVAKHAAHVFGGAFRDYDRLAKVFETSGVIERRAAMPLEWYLTERPFEERTAAYLGAAVDLFCEAAEQALAEAGLTAAEIGTVVTISSSGIATPSLDARAATRLGFRNDVRRVPVFGLGCAGGATGLGIASRLAAAEPGMNVLLVVVELSTLSARIDKPDKANLVSVALFGDGAAAVVLRSESPDVSDRPNIRHAAERMWPNTLNHMGWDVDASGFSVILDRSIPAFVEENVGMAMGEILAEWRLAATDIDRVICHPGGAKVITALEKALGANQGTLDHERDILARYGNMSAPTVLFILQRALKAGLPARSVATAMGPGFTLSAACIETPQ